ncbi:MAG: SPFH domain-containing protein [Bacteroidales bacterium]|jgi:membrane protease subunit (stomatin/prohibitin family)|nr:SPFH domain-containing protein [Bacteroidales bacterium]
MGLIKAFTGSVGSVLADQWIEYIRCDAMPMNVIARKGQKVQSARSQNYKGEDNVITDGSRVDVADGQFMLIVENGRVVDFCAEPGQYIYNTGTEPSLLSGGFKGLLGSFKEVGKRFIAGGQVTNTQLVYYINTKELMSNKWGVGEVPFRDSEFNFSIKLSSYGEYSYKITNQLMFYANVCGNITSDFTRDKIDSQLKAELQSAIQPVFGRIALKRIPYDQLPLFTQDICAELNSELTRDWVEKRGISVVSFAVASVTPDGESVKKINAFQESRVYTDARMMGARLGTAQANAMETAAGNEAGAMTGFMGLGFAQQAGGMNAAQMYQMPQQQGYNAPPYGQPLGVGTEPTPQQAAPQQPTAPVEAAPAAQAAVPAPAAQEGWACAQCGTVNQGNFCTDCGSRRPANEPLYKCDKCGWQPADPKNPPKFCPECGDRFDENDVQK